jgi:hypothetical protein
MSICITGSFVGCCLALKKMLRPLVADVHRQSTIVDVGVGGVGRGGAKR